MAIHSFAFAFKQFQAEFGAGAQLNVGIIISGRQPCDIPPFSTGEINPTHNFMVV